MRTGVRRSLTTCVPLGLDPAALRQMDGSGLSRMDLVSTKQFTELLVAVRHQP
nr:hypothetical protein OG781_07090 [Streptomyces sp. NBC_00830]